MKESKLIDIKTGKGIIISDLFDEDETRYFIMTTIYSKEVYDNFMKGLDKLLKEEAERQGVTFESE